MHVNSSKFPTIVNDESDLVVLLSLLREGLQVSQAFFCPKGGILQADSGGRTCLSTCKNDGKRVERDIHIKEMLGGGTKR